MANAARRVIRLLFVLIVAGIAAASIAGISVRAGEAQQASTNPLPGLPTTGDMLGDVEAEIIVVMEEDATSRMFTSSEAHLTQLGGELVNEDPESQIKTVRYDELSGNEEAIAEKAEELSQLPGVVLAEPNQQT